MEYFYAPLMGCKVNTGITRHIIRSPGQFSSGIEHSRGHRGTVKSTGKWYRINSEVLWSAGNQPKFFLLSLSLKWRTTRRLDFCAFTSPVYDPSGEEAFGEKRTTRGNEQFFDLGKIRTHTLRGFNKSRLPAVYRRLSSL